MKSDSSQRNRSTSQRVPPASADTRWNIHTDVIQHIQQYVDTTGPDHTGFRSAEGNSQLWQRMAMDRIAAMLTELTSGTAAVIRQFNRNPNSFDMDAFIEYLDDSADRAVRLADQIADFAEFGKSNGGVPARAGMFQGGMERRKRER